MAFRYQGRNLSEFVFGFGTDTTYRNFSTVAFNSHYKTVGKTGGKTMRMVAKNANFMPFSEEGISGFKVGGVDILSANAYAGVNRFIVAGASERVSRTNPDVTPFYYKGNGYNSLGEFYIGGTLASHRASSTCPPVIWVGIQGAGGSGSSGLARGNNYLFHNVWQHIGGNGGGSGGFACFQVRMPHNASTPTLVGYFQVGSLITSLRDANYGIIATANAGGNGGAVSGTPSLWDDVYTHSQGNGGSAGTVSILSLTGRPDWKNANFTTPTGGTLGLPGSDLIGAVGGRGGYNHSTNGSFASGRYLSSQGAGKTGLTIYLNNANSGNSITGYRGGMGGLNQSYADTGFNQAGGGGGAGSMFGQGGDGNSAPARTAYGAGGGGGTPTKTSWSAFEGGDAWVSGKAGAGGCVKFFW